MLSHYIYLVDLVILWYLCTFTVSKGRFKLITLTSCLQLKSHFAFSSADTKSSCDLRMDHHILEILRLEESGNQEILKLCMFVGRHT